MRSILNDRTVQCLICLYIFTFLVILPYAGRNLYFSVYRSSSETTEKLRTKAMAENADGVEEARDYLREMTKLVNTDTERKKAKMAVAVITVRRVDGSYDPIGYLTRVMTSLHRLVGRMPKPEDTALFICNVHAGPGLHKEAGWLKEYFHAVDRFPKGSAEAAIMNPFEKEKRDYVFCMRTALELYSPEFVLMVEDDALPRNESLPVLADLTDERAAGGPRWSYVKLYYPERWLGYSFEANRLWELLVAFLFGAAAFATLQRMSFPACRTAAGRRSQYTNGATALLGGAYVVLLALAVSRQHLLQLQRSVAPSLYSVVSAPHCCSPSILYTRTSAEQVAGHLELEKNSAPLDLTLDRIREKHLLPAYLVEPNVFQHIGIVSTIKGFSTHPEEFLI